MRNVCSITHGRLTSIKLLSLEEDGIVMICKVKKITNVNFLHL